MTANMNSWSPGLCLNKSLNHVEPSVPPLAGSDLPPSRKDGSSTPTTLPTYRPTTFPALFLVFAQYENPSRTNQEPRYQCFASKIASAHYEKTTIIARNQPKSSEAPITQGSTYAQNAAQSHPASRNTSATPHFSRGNLCPSTVHTRPSSRIILRGRI